jgi:hypothetical protein
MVGENDGEVSSPRRDGSSVHPDTSSEKGICLGSHVWDMQLTSRGNKGASATETLDQKKISINSD